MDMTLAELQDMSARQQHQIDTQQQLLASKVQDRTGKLNCLCYLIRKTMQITSCSEQEQRLHFLKHQEHKPLQTSSEQKKLQHLRDTVEKQEAQLKMVRALKGQVEQKRLSNGKLGEHHSAAHYELLRSYC